MLRWHTARSVPRTGEEVDARIFGWRNVPLPIGRGVNQRSGAAPIFIRAVSVENLWDCIGAIGVGEKPILVGKGRNIDRIEDVEKRISIARGLSEASVETATA